MKKVAFICSGIFGTSAADYTSRIYGQAFWNAV
jgi:hypothetical protein